ncbi:tetraspanin-9-like [Crassostrea angulata]|uniref:tetraspanin-9-like n=1 Tax=Magallana angulata TaxID=2784310 RepID=UPI0022B0B02A|nr:tetraspanin-9-like [Crassostrea angulata]XP_052722225.1 tetraspanin-9-like [Crassostrea angulata]
MASCCSKIKELWSRPGKLKTVFLAINILLIVSGLACIVLGALAHSEASDIDTDRIEPLMDTITMKAIQPLGVVKNLSIILILLGVFIVLITILAIVVILYGAVHSTKFVQVRYSSLMLMCFLWSALAIVLLTNTNNTVNEMKDKMVLALNHFKADETSNSNSISNAWNLLFMILDCCGVNAVVSTTNDFDATTWCTTLGSCQATSSQIPKTCCLNVDENTYTSAPTGCHASVNSGTYNAQGCHDALKEKLLKYSSYILVAVIITIILEALAVVIGFILPFQHDQVSPNE